MPGLAAAAVTGRGSCAKEEDDDDEEEEEDSWAVKPRGTKHRGHGWGIPRSGGGPGCALGTLLHREGCHSSCLYPHHLGLFFTPSSQLWKGDITGSLWRFRASCSPLPPWSALLLTEKQIPNIPMDWGFPEEPEQDRAEKNPAGQQG